MKRFGNLYKEIYTFDNLHKAAHKAAKGKRYNANVSRFRLQLESELFQLQTELCQKSYQPGFYRTFEIYEPKKRMISAAPFRDRVVHHALCNIIEPIFDARFIYDSYANRQGKGTHAAIERFQYFARNNKYVLKADITKYFPSIIHTTLKLEIRKKIKCKDTLWLIDSIIDNSNAQEEVYHFFKGDNLFTNAQLRKGLPMGNLTSQFFANIYLNALDHFIKEKLRCKHYIRYVDDFVLFSDSKTQLNEMLAQIHFFLTAYRLKLNPNKTKIFRTEKGVPFLGFQIFRNHKRLLSANLRRFYKRMNRQQKKIDAGQISKTNFVNSYIAWQGHSGFANTYKLRRKIIALYWDYFWDEWFFRNVGAVNRGVISL